MPDRKLSVEDILEEIEVTRAKQAGKAPNGDMGRVDDIIRTILEKRREEDSPESEKELTPKEREALEKEIRSQTRSLSKQFEKLQREKEQERRKKADEFALKLHMAPDEGQAPAPQKDSPEIRLNRVMPQQQVKVKTTAELPFVVDEGKKKRLDNLKKAANTQHIHMQMESITNHFGNVKMEDKSVEDGYAKTVISPTSYRELKKNRNQKIDAFMKESVLAQAREEETTAAPQPVNGAGQAVPQPLPPVFEEEEAEEPVFGYEYTESAQTGKVRSDLEKRLKRLKALLVLLGAIGINAFWFSMVGKSNAALLLFGKLAVSPLLYVIISLVLLLGAMGASYPLFRDAMKNFQNRRKGKEILAVVTSMVCLGVNIAYCLKPQSLLFPEIHLYTSGAILVLFFAMAAKYQQASLAWKNFLFLSDGKEKFAVTRVEDRKAALELTKGGVEEDPDLVCNTKAGFLDGFLTAAFRPEASDSLCQKAVYIILPLAIALGALGYYLTRSWGVAFTMLSGVMILGSGFVGMVMVSLPFFDSSAFARGFAGMMPFYGASVDFEPVNAVMVEGVDLFPEDTVVMHGIKTFQGNRIDMAIVDAASVLCSARSVLQHVFLNIIGNNRGLLKPVDGLQYEDLMGLSAWVEEKRVLIGNRELMINHSIAVPKKSYEEKYREDGCEVIYLATGGELCAAFILEFTASRRVSDAIHLLEKYHMLAAVRSVDACLTADLLGRVFDVEENRFKVLPARLHAEYERQQAPVARADGALGNNGAPLSGIVLVAIAKKLYHCVRSGKLLYLLEGICGILLFAAALVLHQLPLFGCWQMTVYLGAFLLLYWLYERNMRL